MRHILLCTSLQYYEIRVILLYNIRPAVPGDVGRLYPLINELEEKTLDEEAFREVFAANLADSRIHYLVAEDRGGRIVGFVSVHIQNLLHHTGGIAEVQELVVTGEKRRTGLGALLLARAKRIAEANGCIQMEVSCNRRRENSHEFYESQGLTRSHFKFCCNLKGKPVS